MAATRVLAVVGATATGKSDLALELAQRLDGEVVNADSMQVYRGMDVGTAKVAPDERRGIAHHVLDVWDVREPANVADYQRMARAAFAEITSRGRTPVLVGGSGLYVRAALDDLAFPGTDEEVRARLEGELADVGPAVLHARLAALDPAAAARILPGNGRRIVRALEVLEVTGAPFAAALPDPSYAVPAVQLGLVRDRPQLAERIDRRVERMWDLGLVEEVRGLTARGLREGRTASAALGYAQVLRFLDGEWSEDRAREETARATRRFARRQDSWFRRDPRIRWLSVSATDLVDQAMSALGSVDESW